MYIGAGGFYTESLAEGQVPTRLAIIAYDIHAKAYTSYYASSVGLVGVGTGTIEGNTWTWMGGRQVCGQSRQRKNDNHDVIAH